MDYIVTTPCGAVRGCAGRVPGTVAYKGIRYATVGKPICCAPTKFLQYAEKCAILLSQQE